MTYGSQIWAVGDQGAGPPRSIMKPLETVQNKCLRQITGAYKRTPVAAIERESGTPPLDIYVNTLARQRAIETTDHLVTKEI